MQNVCDEMVKCGLGGDIVQILKWEDINSKEIGIVEPMVLPEGGTCPSNLTSKKFWMKKSDLWK